MICNAKTNFFLFRTRVQYVFYIVIAYHRRDKPVTVNEHALYFFFFGRDRNGYKVKIPGNRNSIGATMKRARSHRLLFMYIVIIVVGVYRSDKLPGTEVSDVDSAYKNVQCVCDTKKIIIISETLYTARDA